MDKFYKYYNNYIKVNNQYIVKGIPTDGLVSHWPLYDNMNDAINSNHLGTNCGYEYVATPWGTSSLRLKDRADYNGFNNNILNWQQSDFTVAGWFYPEDYLADNYLKLLKNTTRNNYYAEIENIKNTTDLHFYKKSPDGYSSCDIENNTGTNVWFHLVFQKYWDSTQNCEIYNAYFNGKRMTNNFKPAYCNLCDSVGILFFNAIIGRASDIYYYNRNLTDQEIKKLYNQFS